MRHLAAMLALALIGAAPPPAIPSPNEIVAAAPASAWAAIPDEDVVVMTLANGATIAYQLASAFAPEHVAAIRRLVRAGWFDGDAVTRVQDDYVVQWGGADPSRAHPPAKLPAEYDRPLASLGFHSVPYRDAYAGRVGFAGGWPVASDGTRAWLPHCYGALGVGRDMPPDTGDGTELYAVIGHAPRHLDRNIAVVGRVIEGMPALASLPRGTAALGVYADPKQYVRIVRARVAADLPAAERPRFEAMRTDGAAFARLVDARANRRDAFFVRPAGGADICNLTVPTRRVARLQS